ncbi:MAG: LPS assembly lipoprotein LptE [Pseudomonadota bacterium]
MMKPALVAICLTGLAACGFQPMYAPQASGSNLITVAQIDEREGYFLRKALVERLAPGLPGLDSQANLVVNLDQRLSRLRFQPDEAASRTDVTAVANYVLHNPGEPVSGTVTASVSYDVPEEPFADISSQTDALERVMELLSRRIVDDMRLQLANRQDTDA